MDKMSEMTAKELLFLLKEAEQCFWNGFEASCRIDESASMEELDEQIAERDRWEARFEEIRQLVLAEGLQLSCTSDGCFWFIHEKEPEVIDSNSDNSPS
jgi:hypothetical protein